MDKIQLIVRTRALVIKAKHLGRMSLLLALITFAIMGCQQKTAEKAAEGTPEANSVRIAAVTGQVAFQRAQQSAEWIPAVSGMQLGLEDTLTTASSSETDLDVDQDQHVLVGEQVRMVIEKLLKTVEQSKVARLRVDTGALYVRIQRKLNVDEVFEVITPTCVMGVRGTEFVVSVIGSDTKAFVLEGTVTLALTTDQSKAIPIPAGQMVTVPWGQKTLDGIVTVPINFEAMPLDMLEALITQNSKAVKPYLQAVQQSAEAIQQVRRERPELPTVTYGAEKPYVVAATGHAYARIDEALPFEEALAYCEARGGHLMTINSEAEQALAEAMMTQGGRFWYVIGLVQRAGAEEPKGGFEWVTGEPVEFTRWHRENGIETEPSDRSDGGAHENHVALLNFSGDAVWQLGDWNDLNLAEKPGEYGFLCEWERLSDAKPSDVNDTGVGVPTTDPNEINLLGVSPSGEVGALTDVKPEGFTYNNFKSIPLGSEMSTIVALLGSGIKTTQTVDGVTNNFWVFQTDSKLITCLSRINTNGADILYYIVQQGLLTDQEAKTIGITSKDLSNIQVQQDLMNLTRLSAVEKYLGSAGVLMSRLQEDGQQIEIYLWRDAKGYGYQIIFDTAEGNMGGSIINP